MPNPRDYTDDDRQTALCALERHHDGNIKAASRALGIPWSTLKDWKLKADAELLLSYHGDRDEKKAALTVRDSSDANGETTPDDLIALFETEAREALKQAARLRNEATYRQLISAAVDATDKAALLRDKRAVSPETFRDGLALVQRLITHHVNNAAALDQINAAFDRFLHGDAASHRPG